MNYQLKKTAKSLIGIMLLNPYYRFLCLVFPVNKGLVLFADGHQNSIPESMVLVRNRLKQQKGLSIVEYYKDYSFCNPLESLKIMMGIIPLYVQSEYVFISDSFVPVASCRKRKGTTVVQLWHSCGLLKKIGKDSPDDNKNTLSNQFKNTDVITTSSSVVAEVLSKAMSVPKTSFVKTGCTYVDDLYDTERNESIKNDFFNSHPEYKDKIIVLWAPTFRGNPHNGYTVGEEDILKLQKELGESYAIITKTHRFSSKTTADNLEDFSADKILTFADILITDYSSIYYSFLFFRRPIVLFAPDINDYKINRGLYIDYNLLPGFHAYEYDTLKKAVISSKEWSNDEYHAAQDCFWNQQMEWCNGNSCNSLLERLGLIREE